MATFRLNGRDVSVDVPDDMPLLWVLRDTLGFTGTKYGCGIALCGACTVHVDGEAIRSCAMPVAGVQGREVTTIEGPGMIMAVAAFLERNPAPDDDAINSSITNICRCGTYPRIRRAIHRAAGLRRDGGTGQQQ